MKGIFPSLAEAALSDLKVTLERLNPYCDGYHIDIMDAHFVPNQMWGVDHVNAFAKQTDKKIWVHAMVENPGDFVDQLVLRAESIVSIHIESGVEINKTIKSIREKKWIPSIAINPKTNIVQLFPFLMQEVVDHVLIMSVEPGFSGQRFLESAIDKLKALVAYRDQNSLHFTIGMDGGINQANIKDLAQLGVDQFAISSGIFGSLDPVTALRRLRGLIE